VIQHFNKLALIVVMGSGFALAQSTSAPQGSSSSPSMPQTQQQPSTPSSTDQQHPSTAPDQGKNPANAPETLPSTDQKKDDQGAQKLPQSDAAPAAATGDVQTTIQSAIQKDPTLANANVSVQVNGKNVELTGTVPSKDAKEAAARIAKENSGGLKVKNHLKVASNDMDKSNDKPKTDMNNPK
jgi:hypothetical protein